MSYISLLIALIGMNGSSLTGDAWTDAFLDLLVQTEHDFFVLFQGIFLICIILGGLFFVVNRFRGASQAPSLIFGCLGLVPFGLMIAEWITLQLAQSMAAAYTAEGIVNQGQFFISAVLFLLLGAG